ncbi:hypothetical protein [Streptomyces umbrinus]|uniref:hypothetical protein n=1 Tax=Streptomyces umbrinus TaxID=67370 RepID=UPI003408AAEE
MRHSIPQPQIRPPLQARPVSRDDESAPAAQSPGGGVAAARSQCADMTGAARQMCYATKHGIST